MVRVGMACCERRYESGRARVGAASKSGADRVQRLMCSSHLRGVKLPKLLAQSLLLCRLLRPSGAREATRSRSRSGAARGA
jgi:hypothetical protein